MNIFLAFVLGVLVGWLIEWIIDYLYWRRRSAQSEAAPTPVHASSAVARDAVARQSGRTIRADDFKIIKGLGGLIEGKLNAAGIYTFEQLGKLTAVELRQILGDVIERQADEDSLLEQARQLAQGRGK